MKEIKSLKVPLVPLYLPIEYKLSHDQWVNLLNQYNQTTKIVKVAKYVTMYLQDKFKDYNSDNVFKISDVIFDDNVFKTDMEFNKTKSSLATLVIYNLNSLKLVPICNPERTCVLHISLTYTPL